MKRVVLLAILFPLMTLAQGRADWATGSPYSDAHSLQPGGVLTVIIMEFSQASNEAGSTTKADSKTSLSYSPSGGLAKSMTGNGIDLPLKHESNNAGGTSRRGSVTGKLTVRIKSIDSVGNFVVEGSRNVSVNGDKQTMTITGRVRPEDVNPDNTVFSYNIADADLNINGKGTASSASRPGVLTRLFSWIL